MSRLRDRGVDQYGIEAELHGLRRVRRNANARVDHQRDVREVRPQRLQAKRDC